MARPRCPVCGKLMNLTREKEATVYRCSSCDQVDPMKTEAGKSAQSPLSRPR
jgi:DNA-directed RNA polymerase subunit M/transcription elongation factor TFIIS